MKELNVNEKCNGCGFCIVSAPNYFGELPNGNAKAIKIMIDKMDEDQVTNVIRNCPENAIVVTEKEDFSGNKKKLKEYIINKIQKFNNEFKIEKVTKEEYEFWNGERGIYFNISDEWPPAYNSESAAKSAAKQRFREQCYSEQVYRPKLKEIFVNYKVNKLKPFYTDPSKEDSAYYEIVQKVNSFLQNIESELKAYNINVASEWSSYTYPVDEYTYYSLEHFDDRSMSSGIIDKLKSRGSYTTVDWYIDHNVKISPMIVDRKETLFGGYRDINKYYYTGLYDAANEYGKDLSNAIARQSSEISSDVVNDINKQLESLEEDIHRKLEKKIQELHTLF